MAGSWVAQAGGRRPQATRSETPRFLVPFGFMVTHASVETLLVINGSPGHQLGYLRVLPATAIQDLNAAIMGRIDATLMTTSSDYPGVGDEVRMGNLHFIFGTGELHLTGSSDQLLVAGSGFYPGTSSTIAGGATLVRSIIGSSGRYSGTIGSATSEHLANGSRRHTFDFLVPGVRV